MVRCVRDIVQRLAIATSMLVVIASESRSEFIVERVANQLNQPIYVTQAPGDAESLYIVERSDAGSQLGRITKFDQTTQTSSTFLDLTGQIISDAGVLSMEFHPSFGTNGLFYVVSNADRVNRLDEYQVIDDVPEFQRRLIEYESLDNVFHTMNQSLFRPGGQENELFVTTGDGGTQANSPNFDPALIENPDSIFGKLLRVDLNGNFPTPAADPTHPDIDVVALGLRNPYRSSFDRDTGSFYFGDVGFNAVEEINILPAGYFDAPATWPLDYGWTDREGTIETQAISAGGPGSPGDIEPALDYAHTDGSLDDALPHPSLLRGNSVTGGYVYRGPIEELQGQYFFADFTNGNVYSAQFDGTSDVAGFDGDNASDLQARTTEFENLIDGGGNIWWVTSLGEDNAGNLYIVKFGNGFFPSLEQGEILRVAPAVEATIQLQVDRDTGALALVNVGDVDVDFLSYTLSSSFGAIEPSALTPVTGNYDVSGPGPIDENDAWEITSSLGDMEEFSEATTGDAGVLGAGQQVALSPVGGWILSHMEDLTATFQLSGTTTLHADVVFTGNGGSAYERSDIDFNGMVDVADWTLFLANNELTFPELSLAAAHGRGDLDADRDNDYDDFQLFKADYNAVNGAGAFAADILGVPEPSTLGLVCVMSFLLIERVRRDCRRVAVPGAIEKRHISQI